MGHPENSRLAGAPSGYIVRQLADFAYGARKGAANMHLFSRAMTADEMKIAADYFAALPVKRWTRVIETDTVPKTYFLGTRRMPLPAGGTEPIGSRVIEIPESPERVELRDPKSGFVAYAPPGSLAKGQLLVARGGDGKTTACIESPSRLTTQRLRTARFPEQHIDVFAAGNLRVRRDEMVAPLALAHYRARLIKSLSEVSRVPECRIEERVAEIGPFYLVLAAERRVIEIGRGDHQGVVVRKRADENA
jgi:hypothetical protein